VIWTSEDWALGFSAAPAAEQQQIKTIANRESDW
jgi:hypothetical protein